MQIGSTGRNSGGLATDLNLCGAISRNHPMCHILAIAVCLEIIFHIFEYIHLLICNAPPTQ